MSDRGTAPDIPYDTALRRELSAHLGRHDVREHPLGGRRHAAVAVIVLDSDSDLHGADDTEIDRVRDLAGIPGVTPAGGDLTGLVDGTAGGAALLLTRRGGHLPTHARQWAFPGGRVEPGEAPVDAARRETQEEVGLDLAPSTLLGRLDDYPTRSGYVITPFVFWAGSAAEPVANPAEVASVHRVSLRELLRLDSPRFVTIPESDRPVVQVPIGGDLIHAPTGAVLYQFRAVALEGSDTRVDHLEQPVFAWR